MPVAPARQADGTIALAVRAQSRHAAGMETAYDWITMALFAVLAVTYLQRSAGPRPAGDRTVTYLPPALACAAANQLGNHGHHIAAVPLVALIGAYIWYVIGPGRSTDR